MSDITPELVLFDLGGVLVHFRGATRMGELAGISDVDELWRRWLTCRWVRSFESGQCTVDAFAAGMIEDWGLALGQDEFVEEFRSWPTGPMDGAEDLVRQTRKRVRVACFSNTNRLHWDDHGRGPLMELFEATFLSFRMGLIKPDVKAFEHVRGVIGLPPGSVLFLDDNQVNVEAARQVGFAALRVLGVDDARKALAAAGVV